MMVYCAAHARGPIYDECRGGEHSVDRDHRITPMVQVCKRQTAVQRQLLERLQKEPGGQGLALRRRVRIGISEIGDRERF